MFRSKDRPQGATFSLLKSLLKTSYRLLCLIDSISLPVVMCVLGPVLQDKTGSNTHITTGKENKQPELHIR